MEKIIYSLLKASSWILHILPMQINYILSDFFFLITYYIVQYRKKVVRRNLLNSFPEKSENERRLIEKKFFCHLCDTFIETLRSFRFSPEEAKKRCKYLNPELANYYLDQGRPVVVVLGHYNNWEWLFDCALYSDHRFYVIYKKLKSKAFGRFYYDLRSRFGCIPLERADVYRQLVSDSINNITTWSSFIFDQSPRINEIQYWTTFLNQDTAVLTGAEKVAVKLNAAVIYLHMKKIKRGYYEALYTLITDNPNDTAKFEITESCIRFLENIIKEQPEYWLWSHKRWKHKKPIKNEEGL
jgi:Kdo2-lipid IVA lauroyltransferase/acyltransferase